MRKKILLITSGIIMFFIIGYMVLPDELNVNSTVTIDAPIDLVFSQVNDLKNWENWSPWKQLDPKMKIFYGDNTIGVGGSYDWKSKNPNVDSGSLEISKSNINQSIETKIFFRNDKSNPSPSQWMFEEISGKTKVTWLMQSDLGANPLSKFIGIMVNGKLGTLFDAGLNKLKSHSEELSQNK